ncbi:VWA domain-containing protein [Urbifossiella limnaea]|uniref:von Willebrand factor type A domain protein n=1 Tax=Urbifossiella limnaea TaxID=2528023 RepID=A0A517XTV0_9BACT|nr:VWA domain-containing protein [Urbifossiella limnaea]QDU20941.1 von Willebrand factor type A domain protein [Urbifossiella limnaea]
MTALPTGLAGLLADAREFLLGIRFAHPELLLALLVFPVFAALNAHAARRRRRESDAVGRPAAVAGLLTKPRVVRRWVGLAYPLAWVALVLGLAGPRWGRSDEPGIAVGRDVVLVLDLSRSMLATDLSTGITRWEAGRNGLHDLLDAVRRRGGHRVAVIVFAARPKVVVPLTTDYDHAAAVLDEIDGRHLPPDIRPAPDATSGTRIGAALLLALATHDPRFPGAQDIILVSDGDDPAGTTDLEWRRGSDAARALRIPVHTVGIGDPSEAGVPLFLDGEPLEFQPREDLPPDWVRTRLQEEPLRQIAAETGGKYVAARKDTPRLGEFFRAAVEPNPSRTVSEDSVPQPKDRAAWFLAAALGLFVVGWLRGR